MDRTIGEGGVRDGETMADNDSFKREGYSEGQKGNRVKKISCIGRKRQGGK